MANYITLEQQKRIMAAVKEKYAKKTDLSTVYRFCGSVDSYDKLPATGQNVGDTYDVKAADSTHNIKAGDNVAWNGSEWDNLSGKFQVDNATTSAAGLMSAADKQKLDGIAANANKYTLPTASSSTLGGVKIGSNLTMTSGVLSLSKDNVVGALGYTPPTTNTTYSAFKAATASAAGGAGLVPAPAAGKQAQYLRGDGTWATPTNTTYSAATTSAAGLMSAADKQKLDGIATCSNTDIDAIIADL